MSEEKKTVGIFVSNLKRNYKQIKDDRAQDLGEDLEMTYRRKVEDIEQEIIRLQRAQRLALDLSPEHVGALPKAKGFEAVQFVEDDLEFSLSIREKKIEYEESKERYTLLTGIKYESKRKLDI